MASLKCKLFFGTPERIVCNDGWVSDAKAAYRWAAWTDSLKYLSPAIRAQVEHRQGSWVMDAHGTRACESQDYDSILPNGSPVPISATPIIIDHDGDHFRAMLTADGDVVIVADVPAITDPGLYWRYHGHGKALTATWTGDDDTIVAAIMPCRFDAAFVDKLKSTCQAIWAEADQGRLTRDY